MIKALLIVLLPLTSSGDYTTEMPSMQACLEARTAIIQQDPSIKTLCVPKSDETANYYVDPYTGFTMDLNNMKDI